MIKRTTTQQGKKVLTIEEHRPDSGIHGAKVEARARSEDGSTHHIGLYMVYESWRPWRWIKARNEDTGAEAWAFWGMPWFPPGLLKIAIRRALDKVDPS